MRNELDAPVDTSPNPTFTALLQADPVESATRRAFGQVPVGAPLFPDTYVPDDLAVLLPIVAHVVHDPEPSPLASNEMLPFRASRWASPGRRGMSSAGARAGIPVVVAGPLISDTPTGTIRLPELNLEKRKQDSE